MIGDVASSATGYAHFIQGLMGGFQQDYFCGGVMGGGGNRSEESSRATAGNGYWHRFSGSATPSVFAFGYPVGTLTINRLG